MALLRNKLPVFLNNRSDIDEIENIKDKRLAEITHFIIDFSGNVPLIMFEFNNSGPRISDFEYYIRQVSKDSHIAKYCNASLRVKGEIGEILKKLKNVFEIDMKVRQENFHFLKDIDHKFYSSVVALNESYPYESFRISTSYSKKKTNIGGLSLGRRILDYFGKNGLRLEQVEDLKMTVDRGNGAEPLDLITQKENVLLILPLSSPGRPDSRILFENAIEEMNTFMLK